VRIEVSCTPLRIMSGILRNSHVTDNIFKEITYWTLYKHDRWFNPDTGSQTAGRGLHIRSCFYFVNHTGKSRNVQERHCPCRQLKAGVTHVLLLYQARS